MDFTDQEQLKEYIKRVSYIKQISESISIASEYTQKNQKRIRKFWKRDVLLLWLKEQLEGSLELLSSLHAPNLSKFPDQECDGVSLLKIFHYPPSCAIVASYGNIPSGSGEVNFTPETRTLQILLQAVDRVFSCSPIRNESEYIHSINGEPVAYESIPKSALFVPAYSYKTVFGLLYLHSSCEEWFQHCNGFHFLLLGNKLGRFFENMPPWIEDALVAKTI